MKSRLEAQALGQGLPNPHFVRNFSSEFEAADEAVQPKVTTTAGQPMAEKKEEEKDLSDVTDEETDEDPIPMDCNGKDQDWSPPPPPADQGDGFLVSV